MTPNPQSMSAHSPLAQAPVVHLRLLCTTDLHAHVLPYDYFADRKTDRVGLARTAALMRHARREAPNTLTLDNGDFLQGTPLADYVAEHWATGAETPLHPVISAMNAAGTDVATLGNHEFNYGLEFLQNALKGAAFPVVSANILATGAQTGAGSTPLVPPFVLLNRDVADSAGQLHSLKIGVIGFAPPQLLKWDHALLAGRIETVDIIAAAREHIPTLRAQGADVVVALCHSGFGPLRPAEGAENAALGLAAHADIDALVAGHAHQLFPSPEFAGQDGLDPMAGTAAGVPAVMAGANGSQLGVLDLWLERADAGWRVARSAAELRPIAAQTPDRADTAEVRCDPAVKADALDAHRATLTYIKRPIGTLAEPVFSYFSAIAPCPCAGLVAAAQRWYVARHLDAGPDRGLPVLAAAASFRTCGRGGPAAYTDIPAGDVTLRHVADLYPFPNRICAVRITGAEVRAWLERAVSVFHQIEPGAQDAPLLDPRFAMYNFDQVLGVRYTIDVSAPALYHPDGTVASCGPGRVRDLSLSGVPVADDQEFILATNDYRAGGGGRFPGTGADRVVFAPEKLNRDVLQAFIARNADQDAITTLAWSFAPIAGASARFETAPDAARYLPHLDTSAAEPMALTDAGFRAFRLVLG